jgi:fructose/tagatose bisphosphate aldolase
MHLDPVVWYENLDGRGNLWKMHTIASGGIYECAVLVDLLGSGRPALITVPTRGTVGRYEPNANPRDRWSEHIIGRDGGDWHGLGVGDLDGDGWPEAICHNLYYRQRADVREPWEPVAIRQVLKDGSCVDGLGDVFIICVATLEAGGSPNLVSADGSQLSLAENVAMMHRAVDMAKAYGVTVEGEIGHVGSRGGPLVVDETDRKLDADDTMLTDPELAVEFCRRTGVDALAISIGTVHEIRSKECRFELERFQVISASLEVPLVLHGASRAEEEDLHKAIAYGITKTNVETELRWAFRVTLEQTLQSDASNIKPRSIMAAVREEIRRRVIGRHQLLGSAKTGWVGNSQDAHGN